MVDPRMMRVWLGEGRGGLWVRSHISNFLSEFRCRFSRGSLGSLYSEGAYVPEGNLRLKID